MAFAAVLFSLPIAISATLSLALIHDLGLGQTFALYSTAGFLTFCTALGAAWLGEDHAD